MSHKPQIKQEIIGYSLLSCNLSYVTLVASLQPEVAQAVSQSARLASGGLPVGHHVTAQPSCAPGVPYRY